MVPLLPKVSNKSKKSSKDLDDSSNRKYLALIASDKSVNHNSSDFVSISSRLPSSSPSSHSDTNKPVNEVDTESLLNKFLVKNDLKFLENYLSLQESQESNNNNKCNNTNNISASSFNNLKPTDPLDLENHNNNLTATCTATPPVSSEIITRNSPDFDSDDSFMNFRDLVKFNNSHFNNNNNKNNTKINNSLKILTSNSTSHEKLITQIQKKNNSRTSIINEDSNSDEINIENYVKTNDLLIYYKIFNYLIQLYDLNNESNSSLNNPNNPICKLVLKIESFFKELVNFSNIILGNDEEHDNDSESDNIDNFDYTEFLTNSQHLLNVSKFNKNIDSFISNEFLLINWIVKNYESLNYKNLNYLMFLMGGFKPVNIQLDNKNTAGSESNNNESSLKKLKSCSRCRKNKIKCDSMTKFPYSCSNCFKKNMNFIKLYVKKLEREIVNNDSDNETVVNHNNNNEIVSNNLFEQASLTGNYEVLKANNIDTNNASLKMARSSSTITTASTLTNNSTPGSDFSSPASSVNDDHTKDCDCASKHCLTGYLSKNQEESSLSSLSNLRSFLNLFNIDISKSNNNDIVEISLDSQNDEDQSSNSNQNIVLCKIQLISSDLLLKKKSLKKNNLIKTLNDDIKILKNQVDEMILKEQKLLQMLSNEDSDEKIKDFILNNYSNNDLIKKVYDLKEEFQENKVLSKKRSNDEIDNDFINKRQKLVLLSTNDFLLINGFDPVISKPNKENLFNFKDYYNFLNENLGDNKNDVLTLLQYQEKKDDGNVSDNWIIENLVGPPTVL